MNLAEYSDEDLIEEIKHRGLRVGFEVIQREIEVKRIRIGGITVYERT